MGFLRNIQCPVFNAEKMHPADIPEDYIVEIGDSSFKGIKYKLGDLLANFETKTINSRLTSVSGWSVRADWQGIAWKDFVDWVNPGDYKFVYFESYKDYVTTVWREDLEHPRVMLCTHVAGEPIEFEYGGPFRTVIPNLWGYKSCKWVSKIYFLKEYIRGFWESNGYEDRGEIRSGSTYDVNSRSNVYIGEGEVLGF